MILNQEKPGFIYTLIISAVVGSIVGIIDLWAFELSVKSFYGGIATGITLFVSFSVINYFIPQGTVLLQRTAWYFAGGLAGLIWWIVIRPLSFPMWTAIICGILIAVIWWFAEGPATKK
jgi:hypothetical protein